MGTALRVTGVSKHFGGRSIIEDASFTVEEGEVFGFLGPNGSGKTTMIKMILGLLRVDNGTIEIFGHDVGKHFEQALAHVGGIVENPDMYNYLSGYKNLLIYARMRGVTDRAHILRMIDTVGMQNRIRERVGRYSLGMKQRLGLAMTLVGKPRLLVLDEPTNGLDPVGLHQLRDILRMVAQKYGMAIFVSSHLLSEMQMLCDRVGIIDRGRIISIQGVEDMMRLGTGAYRITLRPVEEALPILHNLIPDKILGWTDTFVDLRIEQPEVSALLSALLAGGLSIVSVAPLQRSLEESFLEITGGGNVIV